MNLGWYKGCVLISVMKVIFPLNPKMFNTYYCI